MTRYITTYRIGRTLKNNLARDFFGIITHELDTVIAERLHVDGIEYWQQRVQLAAHDCRLANPRCQPLHISHHTDFQKEAIVHYAAIGCYHSNNDTISSGDFLTICVYSEKRYYTPGFKSYGTLTKLCQHLYDFARNNVETWRLGEGKSSYISPEYIPTQNVVGALEAELQAVEAQFKANDVIVRTFLSGKRDTISVAKKQGNGYETVWNMELERPWVKSDTPQ
jgi:hypothetical protein